MNGPRRGALLLFHLAAVAVGVWGGFRVFDLVAH